VSRTTKCNIPAAALKWSVGRAGVEFGMTSATLRKSLGKNSAQADVDGLFSTRQITDAVFGGLSEEKLATQRPVDTQVRTGRQHRRGQRPKQGCARSRIQPAR